MAIVIPAQVALAIHEVGAKIVVNHPCVSHVNLRLELCHSPRPSLRSLKLTPLELLS